MEAPVRFDGGDLRVVVVEVAVGGADQVCGDGVAEEDPGDAVGRGVGFGFVKGDEDEGARHEVGVFEEGGDEIADPGAGVGDGCVVAVVGCADSQYLGSEGAPG